MNRVIEAAKKTSGSDTSANKQDNGMPNISAREALFDYRHEVASAQKNKPSYRKALADARWAASTPKKPAYDSHDLPIFTLVWAAQKDFAAQSLPGQKVAIPEKEEPRKTRVVGSGYSDTRVIRGR